MAMLDIGEVGRRLGVTVRAVRLYEAAGLIAPVRSLAGRRVFGAADIVRLQQVLPAEDIHVDLGRAWNQTALHAH